MGVGMPSSINLFDEQMALEEYRQNLRDAIALYSNNGRHERDIWCVTRFLTIAKIPFSPADIHSVLDDPPDVRFLEAKFEIKEIQDEGRRRHDEYKQRLEKAEKATCLQDLLESYRPKPISIGGIATRIKTDLELQSEHYAPAVRKSLDILYYFNPKYHLLSSIDDWPSPNEFEVYGWRSICFLKGGACGIFFTSLDSPTFFTAIKETLIVSKDW